MRKPYGYLGSDEAVLRVIWSLGVVRIHHVTGIFGCRPARANKRLAELVTSGALVRWRATRMTLYRIGPGVTPIAPELAGGWSPPESFLEHTLLTADLVVALVSRNLPMITSWSGECELRTWVEPGEAIPDAALYFSHATRTGRILLETDRGTETQRVWRKKLLDYGGLQPGEVVLAAVPGVDRGRRIARAAAELGVPLLAGTHAELLGRRMPVVTDSRSGERRVLLDACAAYLG